MILLGSGASKIFGIKTLQDMSTDLIQKMRDKGYNEIMNEIIEQLNKFDLTPDFESIYTVLEGLTNPKEAVKSSGAFTAFICKDLKKISTHQEFEEILSDYRNFIYNECSLKLGVLENNVSAYDKLFDVLKDSKVNDTRIYTTTMHPADKTGVPLGNTIVTTNYDMSVELYHSLREEPLYYGFRPTNNRYVEEMDINYYRENSTKKWLIKLHGAIWYFRQNDRVIKTITDPNTTPFQIKIDDQMMIYPVGEKPILRYPYYLFYDIFKNQIWRRMIAIGYSFRDEPVNIAILENLEMYKDSKLIIVNPKPEDVIVNLGEQAERFEDQIISVSGKFGDTHIYSEIKNACAR